MQQPKMAQVPEPHAIGGAQSAGLDVRPR